MSNTRKSLQKLKTAPYRCA